MDVFRKLSIADKREFLYAKNGSCAPVDAFRLWKFLDSDEQDDIVEMVKRDLELADQSYEELLMNPDYESHALSEIRDEEIYKMYKNHQSVFWIKDELDVSQDKTDWEQMDQKQRHFIKIILAFFAQADGVVNDNLEINFAEEVTLEEAKMFYRYQEMAEDVHRDVYALLIQTYIKDKTEQKTLFDGLKHIKAIGSKGDWMSQWMNKSTRPFQERLVAFAVVEGIFFSSSFCAIFWFAKQNLLPGLCKSNELIARDEGLHRDFACLLYRTRVKKRLTNERVFEIIRDAVECEQSFVKECLCRGNLIGMSKESMLQYVKYTADHLLISLGHPRLYKVDNPFPWMHLLSLQGKTNFFERRVTEYSKAKSHNAESTGINWGIGLKDEITMEENKDNEPNEYVHDANVMLENTETYSDQSEDEDSFGSETTSANSSNSKWGTFREFISKYALSIMGV